MPVPWIAPRDGPGLFLVSTEHATWFRRVAIAIGAAAVAVLVVAAALGGLPRNPEGEWLAVVEVPLQLGLLALVAGALLFALRWTGVSAVVLALGGTGLAVFAAIRNPPAIALVIAVVFLIPAVLLWLAWQRAETLWRIIVLAVVTTGLLGGAWAGASATYDHYFGPAHPQSDVAALDDPLIEWAWTGAVDASGFDVVVQPRHPADEVTAFVRVAGAGEPTTTASAPVDDGVARISVDGLAPGERYHYRLAVDDERAPRWRGSVTTSDPAADQVVLAFASCARTGSDGMVFDAIRNVAPDRYVITGDMHYQDITRNDADAFARAYDRVLTAPAQAALYRDVPIAYVWDDHDYSGNDGDASAASRPAARAAYERAVPHYPLESTTTINQAFSVGAVRVVLIDTRSARVPGETMLGAEQLAWLERELRVSSPTHDVVILVTPTPWIGAASTGADTWAGFADERRRIADVLVDAAIDNLVIVGGDAHMVAIDDGSNSDYASGGGAAVPVLQAAALDRPGSVKGGPYSHGTYPGAGQYGLVTVTSSADGADVELAGLRYDGTVLVEHRTTFPPR